MFCSCTTSQENGYSRQELWLLLKKYYTGRLALHRRYFPTGWPHE
ncbi:unnamed protein product [Amoebophrya sp. A25]|nr:unnamed protein product [Amoebophrya sp. A25]|eukprot:GSA25T00010466001.1